MNRTDTDGFVPANLLYLYCISDGDTRVMNSAISMMLEVHTKIDRQEIPINNATKWIMKITGDWW